MRKISAKSICLRVLTTSCLIAALAIPAFGFGFGSRSESIDPGETIIQHVLDHASFWTVVILDDLQVPIGG